MKPKNKTNRIQVSSHIPRILSMGPLELHYEIYLTREELALHGIEIDSLYSIDQLSFLITNQKYWNRIQLTTDHFILNSLLYLNRVNEQKSHINYLAFQLPKYEENSIEEKLYNMLSSINETNFLFMIEQPLFITSPFRITLVVKSNDKTMSFDLGTQTLIQETNPDPNNNNKKEDQHKLKVTDEKSSFNQVRLQCLQYDFFIVDINDALLIQPFDSFLDVVTLMKINFNSNIVVRYQNVTNEFSTHEAMIKLNKLYLLTDTFIMDMKDASANFNKHYETFTTNKKQMIVIDDKKVHDYFSSTIACGGALSLCNSKIGLFIDDNTNKISILEIPSNGQLFKLDYDFKPYPKINHSNVDLVEVYKYKLREDSLRLKSIFYGGFLSKFCFCKNKVKGFEGFYPSYLAGIEIIRRVLEMSVNNLPLPSFTDFYIVRLNKGDIEAELKKRQMTKKEGKFVLDCTNSEKSRMKYYVPLFDNNLHEHFSSSTVQNELFVKGFIDTKGFVNFDPQYRNSMKNKKKQLPQRSVSSKKKQEDVLKKYINLKKIENKSRILRSVSPTTTKLPTKPCEVMDQLKKLPDCKHMNLKNANKKCDYCYLSEKSKVLEEKEIEKRKKMQLRKYD